MKKVEKKSKKQYCETNRKKQHEVKKRYIVAKRHEVNIERKQNERKPKKNKT